MRPLVVGAALGVVGALLLAPTASRSLGLLASARAERDALAAAPKAAPATGSSDALVALVRKQAASGGVLIEEVAPVAGARVRLAASGSPEAVIGFAGALERGRPAVRFAGWRLAVDGASVRLTGEAFTPSRPGVAPQPLSAIHGRKLFVGASADAALPPDAPELIGIVGRIGSDAVAIVRGADGGSRTLKVGEAINGWTLASLAIDAAYFTRGTQRLRVPLPAGE